MSRNTLENQTRKRRISLRLDTDLSMRRIVGPARIVQRRPARMFSLLFILSLSYWYCLPVVTQSFFGYNEFRGYDFLLGILILLLAAGYGKELRAFFQKDKPGRWLLLFAVWATLTCPLTIWVSLASGSTQWPFVTMVFLFHLWGFLLAYAALRIFVVTRTQCFLLLDSFLIAGTIIAIIICLQGIGLVPRFWGGLYDVYGEDSFSATLGPNRAMPGHTMILVFAVAAAYWRNAGTAGIRRLWLASAAAVASLAGLGMTGSRTSWSTFVVFGIVVFLLRRPSLGLISLVFLAIIGVSILVPNTVKERIGEVYDTRVESRLELAESDEYLARFQTVDANRYNIWVAALRDLASVPWLIPFGGGFNSYRFHMALDISAHNIYITLIAEVGIVGLLLYLGWLGNVWRESANLISAGTKRAACLSVFLPVEVQALLIAMLVSLLGGEILYPYRPSFAFMGMFLFLCAVMNHRALVLGDRNHTQQDRPKPAIRIHPMVSSRKGRPVRLYGRFKGGV